MQLRKLPLNPSLKYFIGFDMALFLEDFAADGILRLGEHPGHAGDLIDVYESLAVSERTLMNDAPRGKI